MIYVNIGELKDGIKDTIQVKEEGVEVLDRSKLVQKVIDNLIYTAVFPTRKRKRRLGG